MSDQSPPPARPPGGRASFTTFVLSLSAAALQHLGTPVHESDQPCVNLALARDSIELLEMLEQKTRGNLTEEENKLLGTVLYDLRICYVKVAKSSGCPG